MRLGVLVGVATAALVMGACSGSGHVQGEVGAPCYPNGTCNVGLACSAGICVAVDAAVGIDGAPDSNGSDGGSGSASTCGNGVVDDGESCDVAIAAGSGACPVSCDDGQGCTADSLSGSGCSVVCVHDPVVTAMNGDGCCPAGANANTDHDCAPVCGNGVVEGSEGCDDGNAVNTDGCDIDCFASDMTCFGGSGGTVSSMLTIAGTVTELASGGTVQPLVNAAVTVCTGDCVGGNALSAQTSASDGSYSSAPLSTGGTPLDAYVRVTQSGYRTTWLFPALPFISSTTSFNPLVMSNTAFALVASQLGVSQSAGNGVLIVSVRDCSGAPLRNSGQVAVSVSQNGTNVGTMFDVGAISPSAAGTYAVFNVPPGETQVAATYFGTTLGSHVVPVAAGVTTETSVQPQPLTFRVQDVQSDTLPKAIPVQLHGGAVTALDTIGARPGGRPLSGVHIVGASLAWGYLSPEGALRVEELRRRVTSR